MKTTLNELWNLAIALAKEMDPEGRDDVNRITLQASRALEAKLKRLEKRIHEFTEAGGSRRDLSALVPLSWRERDLPFPLTSNKCVQMASIYGIMQSWTLRNVLHTTPRELETPNRRSPSTEEGQFERI